MATRHFSGQCKKSDEGGVLMINMASYSSKHIDFNFYGTLQ